MFSKLTDYLEQLLIQWGMSSSNATFTIDYFWFFVLLIFASASFWIARKIFLSTVQVWVKRSKTKWDDILIEYSFFKKIALFVPILIIYYATPLVMRDEPEFVKIIVNLCQIIEIIIGLLVINSFLDAVNHIYSETKYAQNRSIKTFTQLAQIIIYVLAGIVIIAMIFDTDAKSLLVGLGGFSAVVLLIFKDTILGFVGGLQLASNKIILPGDWISLPQYGADGVVIDITLVTVKIQNWDKTISTIPTYNLVTNPVKNWRGMEESGGRRIKRAFNIDMTSVHFLNNDEITYLKKIDLIKSYVEQTEERLIEENAKIKADLNVKVNGTRQTNLGAFRAYLQHFLQKRDDIHQNMTFLVRQLEPANNGIPMEIYVFSKNQEWAAYEGIQSDITDHILAVIPEFNLRIFQNPTGSDFANLKRNN